MKSELPSSETHFRRWAVAYAILAGILGSIVVIEVVFNG